MEKSTSKRFLWKITFWALILLCFLPPAHAAGGAAPHGADLQGLHKAQMQREETSSSNQHGSTEETGHQKESEGHGAAVPQSAVGHGDSHGKAPFEYFLNWTLLSFAFIVACAYCLIVHKRGKPKRESMRLAVFLVLLALGVFATGQLPSVQRHFDVAAMQFVDGYHESPLVGSVKLLYKIGLGLSLMIYGIMGREH